MSKVICEHQSCTGCSACRGACPKQCITMLPDALDALYPFVDENKCIDCGLCEKTCPNNRIIEYRHPQKVLVAWSNDDEVRRTSASGGIACELYKYWIMNGGVATGVVYNREEGCHFILIEKEEDIRPTQNSKYTFSDTCGIYKVVKERLDAGIPVLFIGVPCQVAGLYGYLKKEYENLTTVDIVCHGMPPAAYLQQHIEYIEKQKKENVWGLSFRDPKYCTYNFEFTLKNATGKEFYHKKVLSTDNYQLGYHRALIYRENCYHCRYARKERISDLTISDFSGLGRFAPFHQDKHNVSCILQNTSKGRLILEALGSYLYIEERPEKEAFDVEKQLKAPSNKHYGRSIFELEYKTSKNYEKASNLALKSEKKRALKYAFVNKCKAIVYNFLVLIHLKRR